MFALPGKCFCHFTPDEQHVFMHVKNYFHQLRCEYAAFFYKNVCGEKTDGILNTYSLMKMS